MIICYKVFVTLAQWVLDWETLVALESSTVGRKLPLEVPGVIPRRLKVEVTELPGGFPLSSRSATGVRPTLIRSVETTSVTPGPTTADLSSVSTHLLDYLSAVSIPFVYLTIILQNLISHYSKTGTVFFKRGGCVMKNRLCILCNNYYRHCLRLHCACSVLFRHVVMLLFLFVYVCLSLLSLE